MKERYVIREIDDHYCIMYCGHTVVQCFDFNMALCICIWLNEQLNEDELGD